MGSRLGSPGRRRGRGLEKTGNRVRLPAKAAQAQPHQGPHGVLSTLPRGPLSHASSEGKGHQPRACGRAVLHVVAGAAAGPGLRAQRRGFSCTPFTGCFYPHPRGPELELLQGGPHTRGCWRSLCGGVGGCQEQTLPSHPPDPDQAAQKPLTLTPEDHCPLPELGQTTLPPPGDAARGLEAPQLGRGHSWGRPRPGAQGPVKLRGPV